MTRPNSLRPPSTTHSSPSQYGIHRQSFFLPSTDHVHLSVWPDTNAVWCRSSWASKKSNKTLRRFVCVCQRCRPVHQIWSWSWLSTRRPHRSARRLPVSGVLRRNFRPVIQTMCFSRQITPACYSVSFHVSRLDCMALMLFLISYPQVTSVDFLTTWRRTALYVCTRVHGL